MATLKQLFRTPQAFGNRPILALSPKRAAPSSLLRPQHALPQLSPSGRTGAGASLTPSFLSVRAQSTRPPKPLTDDTKEGTSPEDEAAMQARRDEEPAYLLQFTCKPCSHRSSHRITHHGYHKGTVLIACPSCNNRHVISDHLRIFMDKPTTLEDILAQKDLKLTKGTVKGDMEWWGDGSANSGSESKPESTSGSDKPAES